MKEIVLSWLPFLSPIVALIVSYFGIKEEDKSIKVWKSVVIALIMGIFMTTYRMMFVINDMGATTNKLISHQEIIKVFDEAYECHPGLGDICRKNFSDNQELFKEMVIRAQNKEYKINNKEIIENALLLVNNANKKILATSYVDDDKWWRGDSGRKYLEANEKAVKRGVEIERVFIFPNKNSFESSKDILNEHCKTGAHTKYINIKDVQGSEFNNDVIIIDDKFAGILPLKNRTMLDSSTLSSRQNFMNNTNMIFRTVNEYAKLYDGCEKK